ncbi:MAG: T9SS type A sorting domain-containing protein [Ignavibacteriaceae bacterium]|nr:T9SS type A sorting domain-containing protein [Ignavibacteriaceae bacterium]
MRGVLFVASCVVLPLVLVMLNPAGQNSESKIQKKGGRGYTAQQEYYKFLHQSDSAQYSVEQIDAILSQIQKMPNEPETESDTEWSLIGPYGLRHNTFSSLDYYSGRVTDLRPPTQSTLLRISAGTGGLWTSFLAPISLTTDKIPVDAIGSFDNNPSDGNKIIIGTGEGGVRAGNGFYYTTNGGTSWNKSVIFGNTPSEVYKLRFIPSLLNRAYAATGRGLFRTTDSGISWSNMFTQFVCTDFVSNKAGDTLYVVSPQFGVYISTGSLLNLTRRHTAVFGDSIGRASLALDPINAKIVYLHAINRYTNRTYGVFKSTDGGANWTNLLPNVDLLLGNGPLFCEIGVNPANPNTIFAGSTQLVRSTNGGVNWQNYADGNSTIFAGAKMHADICAIEFTPDGKVYIGNDGGVAYSANNGQTWSLSANTFPITQYLFFDIGSGTNFAGGTQDNGNIYSAGGSEWKTGPGGDGGGVAFNPYNKNEYLYSLGLFPGPLSWRYGRTTNFGQAWLGYTDEGIDTPSYHWYTDVIAQALDNFTVRYFTNNKFYVYRSTQGGAWQRLNVTPFPCQQVSSIALNFNKNTLYAALSQTTPDYTNKQIRVLEGGNWYERSNSINKTIAVYRIVTHPSKDRVAFACMTGNLNRERLYKTTNSGQSWLNFSGGFGAGRTPLPDVPITSLVVNPFNDSILYAGTEFGIYRSGDNGQNWTKFSKGMPQASQVPVMKTVQLGFFFGSTYIYAATYGNGVYFREITNDRLTSVKEDTPERPNEFVIDQNFPNPFNGSTEIRYFIPATGEVLFGLWDALGKQVTILEQGNRPAGVNSIRISSDNLPSGVYYYTLQYKSTKLTKKLVVLK